MLQKCNADGVITYRSNIVVDCDSYRNKVSAVGTGIYTPILSLLLRRLIIYLDYSILSLVLINSKIHFFVETKLEEYVLQHTKITIFQN